MKRPDFETEEKMERYIQYKLTLERILRSKFIAKGGHAHLPYPIYFAVHNTDRYRKYFKDPERIEIPMWAFDPATVSFTYGGTSTNAFFAANDHPTKRKVYSIDEIDGIMLEHPSDEEIPIEMQVWRDKDILQFWKLENPAQEKERQ